MAENPFRSGYVVISGKPNAGKSTLLNALVGEKVAIVSRRPQTTRDRVAGILTTTEFQIIFLDTPGIIEPQDRFNMALLARASDAVTDADVLYHIVDVTDSEPLAGPVVHVLKRARTKCRFLVLNKMDTVRDQDRMPSGLNRTDYDGVFRVSALKRRGLDALLAETVDCLKPGPMYYDPAQLTDRDERFLAAEIVRERVFHHAGAEIPYAVFTEVDTFEERPGKDFIRITIYVERDSQKGILIGEGGRMLKAIGKEAREQIEQMTGRPAYLELWVKVRKNWRKKESDLRGFGFKEKI